MIGFLLCLLASLNLINMLLELLTCSCHEAVAVRLSLTLVIRRTRPINGLSRVIVLQLIIVLFLLKLVNRLVELVSVGFCSSFLLWVVFSLGSIVAEFLINCLDVFLDVDLMNHV